MNRENERQRISLPELAAIGFLVAGSFLVAWPDLRAAREVDRQKRTMADLRAIATAVEAYQVDNAIYPAAGWSLATASASAIASRLQPTYIKTLPTTDGWKNTIYYGAWFSSAYQVVSYGRDNAAGATTGPTSDFNADIVFENGRFIAWPEGVQQ